jgi:hypothetical protein
LLLAVDDTGESLALCSQSACRHLKSTHFEVTAVRPAVLAAN